jgi:hypothetical protein
MLAKSVRHDPWSIMVSLLGLVSHEGAAPRPSDSARLLGRSVLHWASSADTHHAGRCRPTVIVLDRPSSMTVTVQWCDATSGRYGDQIWRAGVSRENAVCVLSGERINRGDAIYRPRACGQSPLNAGEMILASAIEGVPQC